MDFQRYNDGVGLIAQNKFGAAIPTCPLCSEKVEWEIAFDFSGNLICILAKCPNCGGIIKTIFDFTNEPISTFSVSQIGSKNASNLVEKTKYYIPSVSYGYGVNGANGYYGAPQNNANNYYGAPQNNQNNYANPQQKPDQSDAVGWGFLGFFFPIVGFILWLVWRNEYPNRSRAAGIGCLVSVVLSVVAFVLYFIIMIAFAGAVMTSAAFAQIASLLLV